MSGPCYNRSQVTFEFGDGPMALEDRPAESELIRRFKAGNEEALRILFDTCQAELQARVERVMSRALQRRVSVADVLQEARIIAFERREDLENRGPGSFRKWLVGIAVNKARRAAQRHAQVPMRSLGREITRGCRPDTAACAGKAPSPSQAAICSELEQFAVDALRALPLDYRKVLRMASVERLGLDEIAERMGRSREAVRRLQERALLKFTEIFNGMRGEEDV